jgi:pteridine reductase
VGAEIARTLHGAGASVAIHYRSSAAEAEALATALNQVRPGSAAAFAADLLDMAALPQLVESVVARFGRLDALVNNASSFFATKVGAVDTAAWDDLIGSNLKAPLFLSQAAAPHLEQSGGCIVNITDIHAERPLKGYPLYCAAKAGLLGLSRALALELGPRVRVNAVAPGAIEWPQGTDDFPPSARTSIIDHTLLKRVGSPADIARTVKFLVFDAPYVTGQVINVDGGRTAHL